MSKRIDITGLSARDLIAMAQKMGQDSADSLDKIICCACGRKLHSLPVHLKSCQPGWAPDYLATYMASFPGAPTQSAFNAARISDAQSGTTRTRGEAQQDGDEEEQEEAPALASALAAVTEPDDEGAPVIPIRPRVTDWLEFDVGGGKARVGVWEGWSAQDQAMIAKHDERYEISGDVEVALGQLALGIDMVENVLIIGPTGSGKTSLVNVVSALTNQPITRINFFGDMRPSDLVGDIEMVETKDGNVITSWKDGPVVTAMRRGHILLIDEIDAAPPQVHTVLQRLTERHPDPIGAIDRGEPHAQLLLGSGEVVNAHPAFRIVATANTSGQGDTTGDYAGTFVLNAAALDRWGVKLRHGYPDEATWVKMIMGKTGLDMATAKMLVQVALKINEAKDKARCRVSLSPRKSLVWARITKRVGSPSLAAQMTITNGIDPADPDAKMVADVIRQVVGR